MGKYRAFISYSHADEAWAAWLHTALERYRVPKRLRAGRDLPARLFPVFRDRAELASAASLSDSVQHALNESDALIVICSPAAAASRWVNEEIRRFQALGRERRIFCLLVAGRPEAGSPDCAFPRALLQGADGQSCAEPLAADVTATGDGKRSALLKIIAGLLNVGVAELWRRDAQRRVRVWSSVAAASIALAAITIGLAVMAVLARDEAELRRGQAEGLIAFMLGDLREKLEPIGKLDVLDSVGDQAMRYFAVLGEVGGESEVLARAKALRQIGEVRFGQGRLDPALESFSESQRVLERLHASSPANNDYLFELSQSEFWVGYVAWERKDLVEAERRMTRYMECSELLVRRDPGNETYELELVQAHSNLGSIARERGDAPEALRRYETSIALGRKIMAADPQNVDAMAGVAEDQSWVGKTLLSMGRLQSSEEAYRAAVDLYGGLHGLNVDAAHSADYVSLSLQLADIHLRQNELDDAVRMIDASETAVKRLTKHDPDNARWAYLANYAGLLRATATSAAADAARADEQLVVAFKGMERLAQADGTKASYWDKLAQITHARAEIALEGGDAERALELSERELAYLKRAAPEQGADPTSSIRFAMAYELRGSAARALARAPEAQAMWREAEQRLAVVAEDDLAGLAVRRQLALHTGLDDEAQRIGERLSAAGFHDPRFQRPAQGRDLRLATAGSEALATAD